MDMCASCLTETLDECCSTLDDFEYAFYKKARHSRDYARYQRLVGKIRLQKTIIKFKPKNKAIFTRVFKTTAKACRVMKRNVSPNEAWYLHGEGLLNDDDDEQE